MMKQIFDFLAVAFDKIPVLNKFKGWRSPAGLIALGVLYSLDALNVGGGGLGPMMAPYLIPFTCLALNAKGRE